MRDEATERCARYRPTMRRAAFLGALAFIAIAPSGAAVTGSVGAPALCTWREVLSVPNGWFNDVAVAGGRVWAVGTRTPQGSNKKFPLISTWDGSTWTTTVGKGYGKHEDVLGRLTGDLWVTGTRNGKPVLHHFDGVAWKTEFRDVAFGNSQHSGALWMREGQALIRTTAGGEETRIQAPRPIGEGGSFTADPRGTVWIDDRDAELLHRWDGSRWASYGYPRDVDYLFEMATARPNDVLAVGNEIARWNGSRWQRLREGSEDQLLHDVDALAGKAIGVGQDWGRPKQHGVIGEWNGKEWRWSYFGRRFRIADCPACDVSTVEAFNGVVFAGEREAWAVGQGNAGVDVRGVIFRGSCR
jgi:hypothetical protein